MDRAVAQARRQRRCQWTLSSTSPEYPLDGGEHYSTARPTFLLFTVRSSHSPMRVLPLQITVGGRSCLHNIAGCNGASIREGPRTCDIRSFRGSTAVPAEKRGRHSNGGSGESALRRRGIRFVLPCNRVHEIIRATEGPMTCPMTRMSR